MIMIMIYDPGYLWRVFLHWNHLQMILHLKSLFIELMMVPWPEIQWNFPPKKVLNARHLKPPEVHRGTLSEKMGRASRLRAKSNINMTRSLHGDVYAISSTSTLLGRKRISTGWSQSLPVWRQTYTHRWINPCFNKYLQQPNFNNYLQQPNFNIYLQQPNFNNYLLQQNDFHFPRESRSTQQTHRTRQTPISAFDLCQIQGFENNSPQAIEISLLLGLVTLQSTEPKLSGERCSPFSTRPLTCE